MAFGQSRYEEYNELLNAKFAEKKVLFCAHRGSWKGNIIQNTALAYQAAKMQGADILETDTTASADDIVFALHDGTEDWIFGQRHAKDASQRKDLPNAMSMPGERIQSYWPINAVGEPSSHRVQPLSEILEFLCHGELLNIDRTWRAKGLVLPLLDRYPHMRRQAILKARLRHKEVIEQLENHPVKYMFMPVCDSLAEVEAFLQLGNLNMVGVELLAHSPEDELFQDDAIKYIHSKGLFCWVNALTLTDVKPTSVLYGGLDDDTSIRLGPDAGWGKLFDKGVDVIQTDWIDLLRDLRAEKLGIR